MGGESVNERLRSALARVTGQLPHQVRVLAQDAALQRVPLLPAHIAYVQGICGQFVRRLLKLPAVDELHVGDGRSRRRRGALVF